MNARNTKTLLYGIFLLMIFAGPAYLLSSQSMKIVTGAAVLPDKNLDHYDVYCSEETINDIEGEPIARVNSSDEIPIECFRMPTAYVVHVPMDSKGNQVGPSSSQLI